MQIELIDIHKHYGKVKANAGIGLTVKPGTIHGILGENGAGKSTLMKILSGYIQKTYGKILLDDSPVNYQTPAEASALGIGMLYQDPLDFLLLTVFENFVLGQPVGRMNKIQKVREKLSRLAEHFGFALPFDASLKTLTIGERQQLEILRLLSLGIEILILDEPTTGISSLQKETLFQALKKLAQEGKSVILVSHKLEDVETLCDQVTVLRQGEVAGDMSRPFDHDKLLEMMFGTLPEAPVRAGEAAGDPILSFEKVSATGGRTGLKNCNTMVRQGEVVGLAGLEGSGQGVFLRLAAGLRKPVSGNIFFGKQSMKGKDYHIFNHYRVAFLPSSRLEEGLISGMTITEHFALWQSGKGFFIKWSDAARTAEQKIRAFRIKGTPENTVESLSGGNQQRLLLSFIMSDPALLLLENPTRGLDIESANWVWEHLHQYSKNHTGIVFSSPELDEILMVADRVLVFFDGSVIKDIHAAATDAQKLGRAIAGKN